MRWQFCIALCTGFSSWSMAAQINVPGDLPLIDAANQAVNGDTILVAPGVYEITEPINVEGKAITLLSEEGAAATVIRMAATPTQANRASVLIFQNGEPPSTVVQGFTLTGGKGTAWGADNVQAGGAILCLQNSAPSFRDCVIEGNTGESGGGCFSFESSPTFERCTFTDNRAAVNGGAAYLLRGPAVFDDCVFTRNSAKYGGAVRAALGPVRITDSTIANNLAVSGSGIYCGLQGVVTLDRCTVAVNAAGALGGGAFVDSGGNLTVGDSIIWHNGGAQIWLWETGEADANATVNGSCIEGGWTGPGAGNCECDPLFGGWGELTEVYVDSAAAAGGDGSAGAPFADLRSAVEGFDLALAQNSPCKGIGDNNGTVPAAGATTRLIQVATGTYPMARLHLAPGISIAGAGIGQTTLLGSVCGLRTGAVLSDLTVTGVSSTDPLLPVQSGVCIGAGEAPAILRCAIMENQSAFVGAAASCWNDAAPVFTDSFLLRNFALIRGGAVYSQRAFPSFRNCVIAENSSPVGGGLDILGGGVTLDHCTITGNAGGLGGGFFNNRAHVTITSSIIWDNGAGSYFLWDAQATASVSFSCIEGQLVAHGVNGNITLPPEFRGWGDRGEVWVDSTAAGPGDGSEGAPFPDLASALTAFDVTLADNSLCRGAGEGGSDMGADTGVGGIAGSSTRLIHLGPGTYNVTGLNFSHLVSLRGQGPEDTTIEGTVNGLRSGTVFSDVTVTGGTFGGIYIGSWDSPEVTRCSVLNNEGRYVGGIACWDQSAASISSCVILNNESTEVGGGVLCQHSTPRFINCLIANNVGPEGAALYNENASPEFIHCTITRNIGTVAHGGIRCQGDARPAFRNSIIWGNSPTTVCGDLEDCLTDSDPLFVDAPERDYHLRDDSPAKDMCTPVPSISEDLDGNPRLCGARADAGAFELSTCPAFIRGDCNDDGSVNISDAVCILTWLFLGGPNSTCADAADANDDAAVNISDAILLLSSLFLGGPPPPAPFPDCGLDPTDDELTCESSDACG